MKEQRKDELRSLTIKLKRDFKLRLIDQSNLERLFSQSEYAKMISIIKNHLGVTCKLSVKCITSDWLREINTPIARIEVPEKFPAYGSKEYLETKLDMSFYKELTSLSFHAFILAIAHELCHAVLHGLGHPLRHSEEATDITAMLLGFSINYELGKITINNQIPGETSMHQLGYLTLEEIFFVIEVIEE